jgi:hypothetical protein
VRNRATSPSDVSDSLNTNETGRTNEEDCQSSKVRAKVCKLVFIRGLTPGAALVRGWISTVLRWVISVESCSESLKRRYFHVSPIFIKLSSVLF